MLEFLRASFWEFIRAFFVESRFFNCLVCEAVLADIDSSLCAYCVQSLLITVPLEVEHYGYVVQIFSCTSYDGVATQFIASKYRDRWLVYDQMAQIMVNRKLLAWHTYHYMVPVPMFTSKKLQRGYNQAEELAYALSKKTALSVQLSVVKICNTKPQASLSHDDRAINVRGAFELKKNAYEAIKDKNILVVDDVYTSGNTVKEMVRVLAAASPASISVVVFARVSR